MRTLLFTHPACLRHDPGRFHPERPARLEAALAGARRAPGEILEREAPRISEDLLHQVHEPAYVEAIRRFCAAGGGSLDPDTAAGPESWDAALRAAGAGPEAVGRLRAGEAEQAFLAVRPPGHHALRARAMGFCLFNNAAAAAAGILRDGERAAIVDWDVHHGNGTQDTFSDEPELLYVSLHEYPFYPGTGRVEEVGEGAARGTTVNVPLPPGTGGDVYREAVDRLVVPILRGFGPAWILVSAGYDAHRDDPLADQSLLAGDYGFMASRLREAVPAAPILYFLEGGYDLEALESSVTATLAADDRGMDPVGSGERSRQALERAVAGQAGFWEVG